MVKQPRHAVSGENTEPVSGGDSIRRRVFAVLWAIDLVVLLGMAAVIVHDLVVGRGMKTSHGLVAALIVLGVVQLGLRWRYRTLGAWYPTTGASDAIGILLVLLVIGGAVQGYLAATGTVSSIGGPGTATATCRWTLENHTTVTCVSHATYISAVADVQRFVLGIAFFVWACCTVIMAGPVFSP